MTTLVDIYEAGGALVSHDRTTVTLTGEQMKPFDIVLSVIPTSVEMEFDQKDRVTFAVMLREEVSVSGGMVSHIYHEASVTLPVDQVRILGKEVADG